MDLMNYILLAGGEGGWVQVLIFVVIFVGYGLKMIGKVKSKMSSKEDDSDRPVSARNQRRTSLKDSDYKSLADLRAERRAQIQQRQQSESITHKPIRQVTNQKYSANQPKPRPMAQPMQRPAKPRTVVQSVSKMVEDFAAQAALNLAAQQPKRPQPKPKPRQIKKQNTTAKPQRQPMASKGVEVEKTTPAVIDTGALFSNSDDIRRAIIFQEILSKPLALR